MLFDLGGALFVSYSEKAAERFYMLQGSSAGKKELGISRNF